VAVFIVVGLSAWFVFVLDWETESYKKTPDGKMVAYHLQSTSGAGDAPYGDHIILAPNYLPLGKYCGKTVFAAYCTRDPQYHWLDNHLLLIECTTEEVVTKLDDLDDVHIRYTLMKPRPRDKTMQSSP